jgi:hypothetical protein
MRRRIRRRIGDRHAAKRHGDHEAEDAKADRLARMVVHERAASLPEAKGSPVKAVERPRDGQHVIHLAVIYITNTVVSIWTA